MNDYAQSEPAVRAMIDDVSDARNLYKTLNEFSKRLTKMSTELEDKVGQYLLTAEKKDEIVASYCESFIYAVIKTLEKKRQYDESTGQK